ncbi:MAG: sensor histidine kinase [Demequinaceae bacterium]|nr:sensor histidine kinase [Demequinaceae bacterium]
MGWLTSICCPHRGQSPHGAHSPTVGAMEAFAWSIAAVSLALAAVFAWRAAAAMHRERASRDHEASEVAATRALAISDERARIAREMHDVVAHTLSVVVAQADGGRFVAKKDPKAAARALETIAEVSRDALTEMRGLLGILRESDGETSLGPQPTLDDIPELVASVREGGLDVSYVTTGTPRPLPIGAGLAAYRIVQEALTNVLKHAGPKVTVYVQLKWTASSLSLVVSDDGRGAAARAGSTPGGTGIEGMRERATVFGGTLSAGPKRGGGYVVKAELPLRPIEGKDRG